MTEELKAQIVWQDDKDFGKVCTLTESALDGIINETTKELQEGLKVTETLNKSLNVMNKELEADRDKYRSMVFDLQEQIEKVKKLIPKTCDVCVGWGCHARCVDCDFKDKWKLAE